MNEPVCSLCHLALEPGEAACACPACHAVAHSECWAENRGCGAYGCPEAPAAEKQVTAEAPTYWGREVKNCPQCGKEIKAAALKCRYCQARFESAAPVSREEFQGQVERREASAASRAWGTWLFAGGLIPFLAPVVLFAGAVLFFGRPEEARRLPPLHGVLAKLGVGMAGTWVLVGLLVWAASRGGA